MKLAEYLTALEIIIVVILRICKSETYGTSRSISSISATTYLKLREILTCHLYQVIYNI